MRNVPSPRLFLCCLAPLASALASAQINLDPSQGDPNIFVPETSKVRFGVPCTTHLIYKGTPYRPGFLPWEPTSGPAAQGTISGYHPADIRAAYGLPSSGGTGAIAIIDFNNLTSALQDFNGFSQQFGLPMEKSTDPLSMSNKVFTVVYADGTKPTDDNQGWGGEIALDIEWAHAMAPNAKIYLVESSQDLFHAERVAASLPGVRECSNSWIYYGEFPGVQQVDPSFAHKGVTYFAGSGDIGGLQGYPATSPNVIGCGGETIFISQTGQVTKEYAWGGSGGGLSLYETRPDYQDVIKGIVGAMRGSPDETAVADPGTGVAVFSNTAYGNGPTWIVIGGTSVATPVLAGITNLRGYLTNSSHRELQRIYYNLGGRYYRDITYGTAGSFTAKPGWDFITGIGVPNGMWPVTPGVSVAPSAIAMQTGASFSGTVQSVKYADNVTYNVISTRTSLGQTATVHAAMSLDRDISQLASTNLSILAKAPFASTLQLFVYNWTKGGYDLIQQSPASGIMSTLSFALSAPYVKPSTREVDVNLRAIVPTHMLGGQFTLAIDQLVVAEQPYPAWDVHLPF